MADANDITDLREPKDFRFISFSEFKKADVKKELLAALHAAKIEPACYWSAELVCAGHFVDLWDLFVQFYATHVHIANPKLAVYLQYRYRHFDDIRSAGFADLELRMRNNAKIRRLFCEIVCVLCDAKRKHCFSDVKVRADDYDLTHMADNKLKATGMHFAESVFLEQDSKELFIAVNELAFHLTDESGRNSTDVCFWIEWLAGFDSMCRGRKTPLQCERRVFADVEPKYQMDIVWMVWHVFLHAAATQHDDHPFVQRVVEATLGLFCIDYKPGHFKRRKGLLYFVAELLTAPVPAVVAAAEEPIMRDANKVAALTKKIDCVYRQIKRNEHAPNLDYLHSGVGGGGAAGDKHANLEKTIAQLEIMNSAATVATGGGGGQKN